MTIIHKDYANENNLKKIYEVAYKIAEKLKCNTKDLFYTKKELKNKEE